MTATKKIRALSPHALALPSTARDHIVALTRLAIDYALQPIVEINTGYVYGYEALMRGHEQLHLPSPGDVLDTAAQSNSIVALECMLHARAIAKFASLPAIEAKKLFINLDGRTLSSGETVLSSGLAALKQHGISPSAICFELSEQHDYGTVSDFGAVLESIRRHGIRLAIDDFGLGISELKTLCDYGLDYIKIDGHFIRGIADNQRKRLLVTNFTKLAHVLGIRVIAERVETEAEYTACREAGCDLVQGYFVARPTRDIGELLPAYPLVVTTRAKMRRDRSSDELLVRNQMAPITPVVNGTELNDVFELFRTEPEQSFFPVVDAAGEPEGIVHERDLKPYIYMPYGRDLLKNPSFRQSLRSFVRACPIVDVDSDSESILDVFAHSNATDGVIVTQNMKYIGVLSAPALLALIQEKQVQQAQDQNPLTELPGNLPITDYVATHCLSGEQDRHFCYFDFNDFKPFNDRYGFSRGDRVIVLFATLMRRHLGGPSVFLGHVGGDDFFAGMTGLDKDDLTSSIAALMAEFQREAHLLYEPEDRRAGYIVCQDREGWTRRYRLLRCSSAVLELPAGTVASNLEKIHAVLAQVKLEAKNSASGISVRQFGE